MTETGTGHEVPDEPDTAVCEHWTTSGQGVVLTGSRTALTSIATQLGLPAAVVVDVTTTTAALGLWGDALALYQRRGIDAILSPPQHPQPSRQDRVVSRDLHR